MKILKKLNEARLNLGKLMRPVSLQSVPQRWNLSLEYVDDISVKLDGYLDQDDEPRFIAINRQLPPPDQAYAIAREVGRYAQSRRVGSGLLISPKSWRLVENAPAQIKEQIYSLDLESRTLILMGLCASKAEYFGFIKLHRKKYWHMMFADSTAKYLLLKLRIRNLLFAISWPIRALLSGTIMSSPS
jgi:hypothetical protein